MEVGYDLVLGVQRNGWNISVRQTCRRVTPLSIGFALLFVPLMLFWHEIFGAWIVNTYQATGGGIFDWRAGHMLEVLLSTDRGLLVWTPVTLLCIIGVKWLFRADRSLTLLLSGIALLHLYVISSWSAWSGGDSYWSALLDRVNSILYSWFGSVCEPYQSYNRHIAPYVNWPWQPVRCLEFLAYASVFAWNSRTIWPRGSGDAD